MPPISVILTSGISLGRDIGEATEYAEGRGDEVVVVPRAGHAGIADVIIEVININAERVYVRDLVSPMMTIAEWIAFSVVMREFGIPIVRTNGDFIDEFSALEFYESEIRGQVEDSNSERKSFWKRTAKSRLSHIPALQRLKKYRRDSGA
jgi:hypothetical protein